MSETHSYPVSVDRSSIPDGCIVLFKDVVADLKPGSETKSMTLCASTVTGPFKVNLDTFAFYGFVHVKQSYLSDFVIGNGVSITLYQGPNFDGPSIKFNKPLEQALYSQQFNDQQTFVNDNVHSMIIESTSPAVPTSC